MAMERTGVYWRPVSNLLAGQCALLVVHAQHIKTVPGRTTDGKEAAWIAALLRQVGGNDGGTFAVAERQKTLQRQSDIVELVPQRAS